MSENNLLYTKLYNQLRKVVVTESDVIDIMAKALSKKLVLKIPQVQLAKAIINHIPIKELKYLFKIHAPNFYRKISLEIIRRSQYVDKDTLITIAIQSKIVDDIIISRNTGFSYASRLYHLFKEYQHPYLFSDSKAQGKIYERYFTEKIKDESQFKEDMIEQFREFFLTLEDPDVSFESRIRVLLMFDIYSAQHGFPEYQKLKAKPLFTLLTEVRRILSMQNGKFITMSALMYNIFSEEKTFYIQILNDDTSQRGLTAKKIKRIWEYCSENIKDVNHKAYIEILIQAAGYYLDSVILTGKDTLKSPEREIIAKLTEKLAILNIWKQESPCLEELNDYFGFSNGILFDILSESSSRRFKKVFRDNEIRAIRGKIIQDLAPVDSTGYNELINILDAYNSSARIRYIENSFVNFDGWEKIKNKFIYGDSESQHPKIWGKPAFQEMVRKTLFPRQGGFETIERTEKVYHVFDRLTGEIFSWKKLILTPHFDPIAGDVILIATDENNQEVGVIHHIDFNKDNNRIDNYLWILQKNHITNANDPKKHEYIAKSMMGSIAFEYGFAPRFWSYEAQIKFNEIMQRSGTSFISGDTVIIREDPTQQISIFNFLGED